MTGTPPKAEVITPDRPTCSTCPYWTAPGSRLLQGPCRRNVGAVIAGVHTYEHEFCGDHPWMGEYLKASGFRDVHSIPA